MPLTYPRQPTEEGLAIARQVLGRRFVVGHKDYNAAIQAARGAGLDIGHVYYGESSMHARPVVELVADDNLKSASTDHLARKAASIRSKVESSISSSIRRFNPSRIGGKGAAGRQRDNAHDAEKRNMRQSELKRIEAELEGRKTDPSGGE